MSSPKFENPIFAELQPGIDEAIELARVNRILDVLSVRHSRLLQRKYNCERRIVAIEPVTLEDGELYELRKLPLHAFRFCMWVANSFVDVEGGPEPMKGEAFWLSNDKKPPETLDLIAAMDDPPLVEDNDCTFTFRGPSALVDEAMLYLHCDLSLPLPSRSGTNASLAWLTGIRAAVYDPMAVTKVSGGAAQ